MNAKEYFEQIYCLERHLDDSIESYETIKSIAESTTAKLSGMPGGGGENRKQENLIVKMVCLEEQIHADVQRLEELKTQAIDCIYMLEDPMQRKVIEKRYLKNCSWNKIICELNSSRSYAFAKGAAGLKNLDKIMENKGLFWTG